MIKCDLLKILFVWNFHNKIVCIFYISIFGTSKQNYGIKTTEMISFQLLLD